MTTLYIPTQNSFSKIEIGTNQPESTETLRIISEKNDSTYFIWQLKPGKISFDDEEFNKWIGFAQQQNAAISYSNFTEKKEHQTEVSPIEYHLGSIRDDFDFGSLVVIQKKALEQYLSSTNTNYNFAGWYAFRLWVAQNNGIVKFKQLSYHFEQQDLRKTGEKMFDYVDPQNRNRQIEMEEVATLHLEKIGAKVTPPFKSVDFSEDFPIEASVIIPVLNREKTIADAITSVLKQKTNYRFNLIIVDNHSTDKTCEIIDSFNDERIIHLVPERKDLGIGGCWNEGINHTQCGKFAIQLDSDDLYSDENTLQTLVDKFHSEQCAMVIGSYQMVNFDLEEIPPGIIDHKEWTDNNGPNNALRINGLGAPRAFYTPVIREIGFPNVSYGEDYAVALAISRTYKVGRIYNPIYLCRRWDNNTDSNLSIEKMNAHNAYKDGLRKREIETRQKTNH